MTTTYSIDDGHSNQITTGLSERDARTTAQRIANERGESVYLYSGDSEPVEIKAETVRCQCGEWSGERCEWVGPKSETVRVEWMPEHLRASHVAANNGGSHPANGSRRLRVQSSCADSMVESDGEWVTIV